LEEAFLWETRTTTCGDGLDFLEDKWDCPTKNEKYLEKTFGRGEIGMVGLEVHESMSTNW
jgi:hypothetical protein